MSNNSQTTNKQTKKNNEGNLIRSNLLGIPNKIHFLRTPLRKKPHPMTTTRHPKADVPVKGLSIKLLNDARLLEKVKLIDLAVFPVRYTEKYYESVESNITQQAHPFNVIAFYHDILVGSCTCRLEHFPEGATPANPTALKLYIMTIGVLAPYRRLGIGAKMLQKILDLVAEETNIQVAEIQLHVQVGSEVALEFYKTFDFTVKERVTEYYRDLDQCDAWLLSKVIPQPNLGKIKGKK